MSIGEGADTIIEARQRTPPSMGTARTQYPIPDDGSLQAEDAIGFLCDFLRRMESGQVGPWRALSPGRLPGVSRANPSFLNEALLSGKDGFKEVPTGPPGVEIGLTPLHLEGVLSG